MSDSTEPTEGVAVFAVRDVGASLAYFRDALGFDVAFTWGEPTYYAGVCRGAVTIHLQAASRTTRPPARPPCASSSGARTTCTASSGSARILKEPAAYPYGMRDFDVADLDGNVLVFGSPEPGTPG